MTDFIKVKATNNEGRVALWDRDAAHPTGEVFVTGDGSVVEVANTAAVRAAIKAGELVEVQPEVAKSPVKQEVPPTVELKTLEYTMITEREPAPHKPVSEPRTVYATDAAAIRQEGSKTTKR